MDYKNINKKLKYLLEEKNYSIEDLSLITGIELQRINEIVNIQDNRITEEEIERISKALDVDVNFLVDPKYTIDIPIYPLDPIKIGEKIRYYRKQKKISLRDISDRHKIFSLGKLSNIENGNLSAVNIEDIQILCNLLDIPIEFILDPDREETIERYKHRILTIRLFLNSYLNSKLEEELDDIEADLKERNIRELEPLLFMVQGIYYEKSDQDDLAEEKFLKAVKYPDPNKYFSLLKVKCMNALYYIAFKQQKRPKVNQYFSPTLQILNDFTNVETNDDLAYAFYNLAVGSLYLGHDELVIQFSGKALRYNDNHFRYQIKLLMSIPLVFMNEFEAASHTLNEVINYFEKVHDLPNLHTAFYVLFYLSQLQKKNVPESVKAYLRLFEHQLSDEKFLESKDIQEVTYRVKLLHIAIGYYIAMNQYPEAEQLIERCLSITEIYPTLREIHANTYYLASKVASEMLLQKEYLEMALGHLADVETIKKGIILYELGCLEEGTISYFQQSSQIFHAAFTSHLNLVHQLMIDYIPLPKY